MKGRDQLKNLETKSDSVLRRLADSGWTAPILIAVAVAVAVLLVIAVVLK